MKSFGKTRDIEPNRAILYFLPNFSPFLFPSKISFPIFRPISNFFGARCGPIFRPVSSILRLFDFRSISKFYGTRFAPIFQPISSFSGAPICPHLWQNSPSFPEPTRNLYPSLEPSIDQPSLHKPDRISNAFHFRLRFAPIFDRSPPSLAISTAD